MLPLLFSLAVTAAPPLESLAPQTPHSALNAYSHSILKVLNRAARVPGADVTLILQDASQVESLSRPEIQEPPLDKVDKLPILIGSTTPEAILAHRAAFAEGYEKAQISYDLLKRWEAIKTPCTLVVVFGSWCSDSYHWVPDLIKLSETPNPYISLHWIGVARNKSVKKSCWPAQSIPKKTRRVPTFWLFKPAPGGKTKLAGKIVENPPKIGQGMAEALVELLESSL